MLRSRSLDLGNSKVLIKKKMKDKHLIFSCLIALY